MVVKTLGWADFSMSSEVSVVVGVDWLKPSAEMREPVTVTTWSPPFGADEDAEPGAVAEAGVGAASCAGVVRVSCAHTDAVLIRPAPSRIAVLSFNRNGRAGSAATRMPVLFFMVSPL